MIKNLMSNLCKTMAKKELFNEKAIETMKRVAILGQLMSNFLKALKALTEKD